MIPLLCDVYGIVGYEYYCRSFVERKNEFALTLGAKGDNCFLRVTGVLRNGFVPHGLA